ncbi:MAG: DUF3450 domain-containing protein [Nitrospiria bacterium]
MNGVFINTRLFLICMFLGLLTTQLSAADLLDTSIQLKKETNEAAIASQEKIDQLSEETARLLSEYRQVNREIKSLHIYNDQLRRLITSQEEEMRSLHKQLSEIEVTHREIVPLTLRMVEGLARFVELDLPFLKEERQTRIEALQEMMDRASITLVEKYRRVMEAYLVETGYGRTIEAYRGEIEHGKQRRMVNFLRLGRLSLIYLTLDNKEGGYWDQKERGWKALPSKYHTSIVRGIRIARKEAAPDLLKLPIVAPEEIK